MKRIITLFLMFVSVQQIAFSQAFIDVEWYDTDSLIRVLPDQQGIGRLNTLNRLSASFSFENAAISKDYADQAMALAISLNSEAGIAAVNHNYGRIRFYEGDYPRALNFYQEALIQYESLGEMRMVAKLYYKMAATHYFAGNPEKSIEIGVNKSLGLYRTTDKNGKPLGTLLDTVRLSSALGLLYRTIGRSDTALLIYLRYLETGKQHNFEHTDMMVHYGLVAGCYTEIGNNDSAIAYFRKSFDFEEINISIKALKHEYMRRLGDIYYSQGEKDSAVLYFTRAYEWLAFQGYLRQSQMAALKLGQMYSEDGRMPEARLYFGHSENLLNEMLTRNSYYRYDSMKYTVSYGTELYLPFSKKQVRETIVRLSIKHYNMLYRYYLERDDLRSAMHYLQALSSAKDTLAILTRNREAIEIQMKYEAGRKDNEILSLGQSNELKELRLYRTRLVLGIIAGLAVVIALFLIILTRQNKIRLSQQTLILRQKLLRLRMNPHFIFNALSGIQSFILGEEPDKASYYLSKFSTLVRSVLYSSANEYITLENELKAIDSYLSLQKIRYPNKFDYSIDVDALIDPEYTNIPTMLAQPFIENAIEHGVKNLETKGRVTVRFRRDHALLILEIEDNGVGRKKAEELLLKHDKDHKSMAIDITRERLDLLNKKLNRKINLDIRDLRDEAGRPLGTLVKIEIPQ
jgi:tetratricopeptide (TPR) repeat protein